VRGLLGNAREMTTPVTSDVAEGSVLVKGAGVGDSPAEAAIHVFRPLGADERHSTTGFRCVREIPAAPR
jgi:hypothetical protein